MKLVVLIVSLSHLFQPVPEGFVGTSGLRKLSFGLAVKCFDLSRHDTNDQPGVTDFDQNDSLPGADHQSTDNLHGAGVAKSLAAIESAQEVGARKKEADDQCQTEEHLKNGHAGYAWSLCPRRLCKGAGRKDKQQHGAEAARAKA